MEYFLIKPNGEQTGTFSIDQVKAMLAAGYIDQDARYWHEGITDWQPIDRIDESLQFEPPPAPPSKTVPPEKLAAVLKAVPPPSTKLEKSKIPGTKPKQPENTPSVPAAINRELEPGETDLAPETVPAAAPDSTIPPIRESRSRIPRLLERALFMVLGAVIAVAVLRGDAVVNYVSDLLASKIVLTDASTFVLLDPSSIKAFSDSMQDSTMIKTLKDQIAQTNDPVAIQRLNIGIETENARHAEEIRQQFLRANSAQFIDPGTYRILAYYDAQGAPITPRNGQPAWVAITYKDHTVYAFKAGDSASATQ